MGNWIDLRRGTKFRLYTDGDMTPTKFTEYVQSKFDGLSKVEIIVRDKYWVEEKKKGSFLSVSKGSNEPLKFLEMHYKGGGGGDKSQSSLLALVGKGIA